MHIYICMQQNRGHTIEYKSLSAPHMHIYAYTCNRTHNTKHITFYTIRQNTHHFLNPSHLDFLHPSMHIYMPTYIYTYIYISVHTYIYIYIHIYIYIYVSMYIYMYMYMYIYKYVHMIFYTTYAHVYVYAIEYRIEIMQQNTNRFLHHICTYMYTHVTEHTIQNTSLPTPCNRIHTTFYILHTQTFHTYTAAPSNACYTCRVQKLKSTFYFYTLHTCTFYSLWTCSEQRARVENFDSQKSAHPQHSQFLL